MGSVTLSQVGKTFGSHDVIRDVSIEVEAGEFCVFVGPSGCGKSTLLRMIAGLEDVTRGEIRIAGRVVNDLLSRERGISMVFQSYALFPHKTVFENIAYGLRIAKTPKQELKERVIAAARTLKLEPLLDRKPAQLSGGQRQRVAIGRSIVRKPDVFLFDEPLSNLDAALRGTMRAEIGQLHGALGATMIYVTHDQVEAMTLADKIVVLDQGQVRQIGTPMELYDQPRDLFVAKFIGAPAMNLLAVSGVKGDVGIVLKDHLDAATVDRIATIGFRPEDMALRDAGHLAGRVILVERLGDVSLVTVALSGLDEIIVKADPRVAVEVGDEARIQPDWSRVHLFDQEGLRITV